MRLIDAEGLKISIAKKIKVDSYEKDDAINGVLQIIDEQPAVPTFGQWIPASNPPENREDVIVCVSGRWHLGSIIYDHGVETRDCCYEDGAWYVCGFSAAHMTIHAWMPLPEPPKGGRKNDK